MLIAVLGAYGANKEKRGALIAFLVFMVIGSLIMLRGGITAAIARPQLEPVVSEALHKYLPLDTASEDIQEITNSMQAQLQCCGLFSSDDWRGNVPDSCNCSEMDEEEEKCKIIGYNRQILNRSIYSKPCFPIIMRYIYLIADIIIGITFALATLALLGLALSSIMIHQLRYPNRPTMILTVPAVFTPQPPKYQELHNPPSYTGY